MGKTPETTSFTARRKPPTAAFATASRKDRIRALQLFLAQLRAAGDAWSDGRRVLRGPGLVRLKADTIDAILRHRDSTGAPPRDALPWQNLAALLRMRDRRSGPEAQPLVPQLVRMLAQSARDFDPASEARSRILRRALRRLDPERLGELDLSLRASPKESHFIVEGLRKKPLETSVPVEIAPGAVLPASQPVKVRDNGAFRLDVPGLTEVAVERWEVRRVRNVPAQPAAEPDRFEP
ncbi:hypothetical protein LAZ40_04890 [Cereibacter sphaeroides]|uniref:hypothetical protein n=1 Tax=Cereibacter sphaeroides TaxID=1063 RepID=UPI001F2D38B2|nr:hypothetical protein [Cereibacter sphaeroides]MCE6958392.1 hypothetical protein [Cereibacter sphaeroides]MCE6972259.1 hypothetical protein [Cereibacter sphaeroides]